ncbi:ABC transporter ATP-binding protein [Sesbania bispinosa]|nr:ABC transporter ATP-binding protein [Sesbania bispinosa]
MPPSSTAFIRCPEPACGLRRASLSLPFAPPSHSSRRLHRAAPSPPPLSRITIVAMQPHREVGVAFLAQLQRRRSKAIPSRVSARRPASVSPSPLLKRRMPPPFAASARYCGLHGCSPFVIPKCEP